VLTRSGEAYEGIRAVVALPPTLAGRLEYRPALPPWRDQLTQRVPAGSVIKVHLVYDEPFWRHEGLSGQAAGDTGPVKVVFDNSPPSGRPGILVGFMEGDDARAWSRATPKERAAAAAASMAGYFGPRAGRPSECIERDWSAEEFSRGCYGAHFGPGTWTSLGPALREPVGPLHWAGAEYATVWNGYMEGAVRSGEDAARAVLCAPAAPPT
jgi:monoamine oxidase